MELVYSSPSRRRHVTALGIASISAAMGLCLLPAVFLALSVTVTWLLAGPAHIHAWVEVGSQVLNVQNLLVYVLPSVGALAGMAGVLRSHMRCPLSAAATLFNTLAFAGIAVM